MGNRAVITTEDETMGIYLHWNGGYDSVNAFLKYCELQEFRTPTGDLTYGFARLTQVICNFFHGGLSCGVGPIKKLDCDNGDNGVYIIKDWEIVGRKYHDGPEQTSYDLLEMLKEIDRSQPEHMRIGDELEQKCVEKGWLGPKFKIGEKVKVKTPNPNSDEKIEGTIIGAWKEDGKQGYTIEIGYDHSSWFYSEEQVEKNDD